jgi:hypothetical protein
MLRDHCSLYNGALQERRDAYRHASKTSIKYGQQPAQLKDIRSFALERQGRWSFSSQQATLRRLDKAFAAFFRRAKSGKKPGYPRFRGVNWFDAVEFPRDGDGCRWDSTPHDPVTRVRLQGVGRAVIEGAVHQLAAGIVSDGDQAPEILAFRSKFVLDASRMQELIDVPPVQNACRTVVKLRVVPSAASVGVEAPHTGAAH